MSDFSLAYSYVAEKLLNVLEKKYIDEFYGKGTYLKIRNVTFSPTKKSCIVDCVVILGETLNESVLNDDMTRLLVITIMEKLLYHYTINVMVSYDV